MSIISREAESKYPPLTVPDFPGHLRQAYTSDDLQEAYMMGAVRGATAMEIEMAAEMFAGQLTGLEWDELTPHMRVLYIEAAQHAFGAARLTAVREDE